MTARTDSGGLPPQTLNDIPEIRNWSCHTKGKIRVRPGLGMRIHGEVFGLQGTKDGTGINTGPVVRAYGRIVEFLNGSQFRLGDPEPGFRDFIDGQAAAASQTPVDWDHEPFQMISSQASTGSTPAALAAQIIREDQPAQAAATTSTPKAKARVGNGLMSLLRNPLALLGRKASAKSAPTAPKAAAPSSNTAAGRPVRSPR